MSTTTSAGTTKGITFAIVVLGAGSSFTTMVDPANPGIFDSIALKPSAIDV